MSGFFVSNFISNIEYFLNNPSKCVKREMKIERYTIKQYTSNKFLKDKIFEQNVQGEFYLIEGVILNKNELISKNKSSSWLDTLQKMKMYKEDYFSDFRGTFSGAHYMPREDEWVFYTNHLGDHPIFYWNKDGKFIVTSDMNWMVEALKSVGGINYTLDKRAIMSIMSYGWVEGDGTVVKEVRKLLPGNMMKVKNGNISSIYSYHKFVNTRFTDQSEDEIIEEIDTRFRHAVSLEYDKDEEYGYKHMACLSGGLDSRMSLWVAKSMGYNPITALTFSQSGGNDILIASQIAAKLQISHLIKTLDNAEFFEDIPKAVKKTFGLVDVSGQIHGGSMTQILNLDEIGISHGGLIGDVILGSKWKVHVKPSSLVGKNGEVALIPYDRTYDNEELYFYYERQMHSTLGVQCGEYELTEYASPFTDIDFWEYCLSIPLSYRYEHYIYKKWILKKYPEAAEFKWEKTGRKITDSKTINYFSGFEKMKKRLSKDSEKNYGMNPFDYWYESIPKARKVLDDMFNNLIEVPLLDSKFKETTKKLYNESKCRYKIQLISALQSINEYF